MDAIGLPLAATGLSRGVLSPIVRDKKKEDEGRRTRRESMRKGRQQASALAACYLRRNKAGSSRSSRLADSTSMVTL